MNYVIRTEPVVVVNFVDNRIGLQEIQYEPLRYSTSRGFAIVTLNIFIRYSISDIRKVFS